MAETIKNINNNQSEQDTGVDYAIYGDTEQSEMEYISPSEISQESIEKIKQRRIKLDHFALSSVS